MEKALVTAGASGPIARFYCSVSPTPLTWDHSQGCVSCCETIPLLATMGCIKVLKWGEYCLGTGMEGGHLRHGGEGLRSQSRGYFKGFFIGSVKANPLHFAPIYNYGAKPTSSSWVDCEGIWTWRMSGGCGRSRILEDPFPQLRWTHLANASVGDCMIHMGKAAELETHETEFLTLLHH